MWFLFCFVFLVDCCSFVWIKWSQVAITYPYYMVDYMKKLDIKNDLDILKEKGAKSEQNISSVVKNC